MVRVTDALGHSTQFRSPVYRRISPPRWPFLLRGLLPLLGLFLVTFYGVTRRQSP